MSTQTIILLVAIVMLGIGVWANIRMKSPKEPLVAGQSLGFSAWQLPPPPSRAAPQQEFVLRGNHDFETL